MARRIGVLTSGGDAPGMNAAIRGVVRAVTAAEGEVIGIRRPDLFLAVCGRSCVFHKETVEFSKFDKTEPNKAMPIFLYHGEVDNPRVKQETELARSSLAAAGFTTSPFTPSSQSTNWSTSPITSRVLPIRARLRPAAGPWP